MSSGTPTTAPRSELNRLGNTSQCPICGSEVHSEAYHCTKCRSFFCYHCRARLGFNEAVLQCGNRDCGYYGKLLCSSCDTPTTKQEAPLEYIEPIDGYWPGLVCVSILVSLLIAWKFTWSAALIAFLTLFAGVGTILQSMQFNIFGKQRHVSMPRTSNHHSCICCNSETKITSIQKRSS